jgi:hypothetical protein
MGDYDAPALTGEKPRRRPYLAIGAAVLTLVVGLAVGFVVGGGTSRDTSVASVETAPETPPTMSAAPPDPDTPQPCLAAGAAGTQVLAELEAAVAAIGALDPTALRQILDRLQPVQQRLEDTLADCDGRLGATSTAPAPTR